MFGIDLFDSSLGLSLLIATLGGLISFLSPCVLPIVPPYLAYMAGTSPGAVMENRKVDPRVLTAAGFFVLGLSTVFILLGLAASAFGQAFMQNQTIFGYLAGFVIIMFGLHFLKLITIPFLFREARIETGASGGTPLGAYVLGLAFAFGWTPCIGPVLGAILALAAQESSVTRGVAMMAFYAAGLGIPFLLAAVFIQRFMAFSQKFKKHMARIEQAMGGLLVVVGVLLITGGFADISFWLLETFPILAQVG